jgi:hypothetical protein
LLHRLRELEFPASLGLSKALKIDASAASCAVDFCLPLSEAFEHREARFEQRHICLSRLYDKARCLDRADTRRARIYLPFDLFDPGIDGCYEIAISVKRTSVPLLSVRPLSSTCSKTEQRFTSEILGTRETCVR